MIRPITCVTFLLACGSGLYLYQTKHKVHVLDAQIDQVVHRTQQVREQTRVLHAEWTLLDQPGRLQQLATQFLALQPTKPSQFVAAADLDSRLPPPIPPQAEEPAAPTVEEPALVASDAPTEAPAPVTSVAQLPRQGSTTVAAISPPVHVEEHPTAHAPERVAEPSRQMVAVLRTPRVEVPAPRPTEVAMPRPVPLYAVPAYRPNYRPPTYQPPTYQPQYARGPIATTPVAAGAPAYGGSMLGMARGAAPPPPTPAPATAWVNWNR